MTLQAMENMSAYRAAREAVKRVRSEAVCTAQKAYAHRQLYVVAGAMG